MSKKPKKAKKQGIKSSGAENSPLEEPRSAAPSSLSDIAEVTPSRRPKRGAGTASAGQSGDLQGLSRFPDSDSQSIEELVEEGQSHEADVLSGIEDAPDADQGEVRTHETPGKSY